MSCLLLGAALLLPVALAMPAPQLSTTSIGSSGWSDGGINWNNPSNTVTLENGPVHNSKNSPPCQSWQSSCYGYNNNANNVLSAPGSNIISIIGNGISTSFTKVRRHPTQQKRQAKSRCYINNKVVTCPSTVPLNAASSSFGGLTFNPNFSNKPPGGASSGGSNHGAPGAIPGFGLKTLLTSGEIVEANVAEGEGVRDVATPKADILSAVESEGRR
jgi:hypothetical protein